MREKRENYCKHFDICYRVERTGFKMAILPGCNTFILKSTLSGAIHKKHIRGIAISCNSSLHPVDLKDLNILKQTIASVSVLNFFIFFYNQKKKKYTILLFSV